MGFRVIVEDLNLFKMKSHEFLFTFNWTIYSIKLQVQRDLPVSSEPASKSLLLFFKERLSSKYDS